MVRPLSLGIRRESLWVVAVLLFSTLIFWGTRLDLAASNLFFSPCCGWPLQERQPWSFLFRYGVLAGVLLAAASLVALTLSYWYPTSLFGWRRPALFLVLVALLGPGLVVNVAFKDHYGRPRPREVVGLGGEEPFLPVWVPGKDPQAKSFPCGHCSMGFYLSVPYLVLKRKRRRLARLFLLAGFAFGGLLGAARMMAGGHFLSDVVWSGGMVWLTALAVYHLLDLDAVPVAPAYTHEPEVARRRARAVTLLTGLGLGVLTVAALLATPYISTKEFSKPNAQLLASSAAALEVSLNEAAVSVAAGPDLLASYHVQAFGLPLSRFGFLFTSQGGADHLSIERQGWFTERRLTVDLHLPSHLGKPLRLRLRKGKLLLDLRGFPPSAVLDVEVGEGEVRIVGSAALAADRGVRVHVAKGEISRD